MLLRFFIWEGKENRAVAKLPFLLSKEESEIFMPAGESEVYFIFFFA